MLTFFNDPYLTPNGIYPKDDRFTMLIVGGDTYVDWFYISDLFPYWVHDPYLRNRQISVIPRFDDSQYRNPPHIVDAKLTLGVYKKQWERAIKLAKEN